MRELFSMDAGNYPANGREHARPSVRAIIIEGGRIAMVHSLRYDYYKFPGGGMESGEDKLDTLLREVREEAGLVVDAGSVREYGRVRRRQRWDGPEADIFVQENYYYLCRASGESLQELDDYEREERFTLEWVEPAVAIAANRSSDHGPKDAYMIEREARVLELLIGEGYFAL